MNFFFLVFLEIPCFSLQVVGIVVHMVLSEALQLVSCIQTTLNHMCSYSRLIQS